MTFLALNLTCYRNLCRFNQKGEFNSPSNVYDESRYILNKNDISNKFLNKFLKRITIIKEIINANDYQFVLSDYKTILDQVKETDFIYADPPYLMKNTTYYTSFDKEANDYLINWLNTHNIGYAYSNWYSDSEQINPNLSKFTNSEIFLFDHKYYIGTRNKAIQENNLDIKEALIISKNNVVKNSENLNGLKKYM